jgi:nucleotidyltransferase-like protein
MTPARRSRDRALAWADGEADVRAVVIFGSVATGRDDELSDLDLILVAEPGRRDELWRRRTRIAEAVLAAPVVSTQEPTWQAEFRFQAATADLAALDLTIAESTVDVFAGLTRGYTVLIDRGGVGARLAEAVAGWHPAVLDAAAMDPGTWSWFRYLHGRIRKGERFAVRAGLHDTLMFRVIPLLGAQWHCADSELTEPERRRIHAAMPRSSDDAELARALRDTAALYEWALDRWTERTGRPRPTHPLAPAIRARLAGADPDPTT